MPMAPSIRGAGFRAVESAEKRGHAVAGAKVELTEKRQAQGGGHSHNCALYGCYGTKKPSGKAT